MQSDMIEEPYENIPMSSLFSQTLLALGVSEWAIPETIKILGTDIITAFNTGIVLATGSEIISQEHREQFHIQYTVNPGDSIGYALVRKIPDTEHYEGITLITIIKKGGDLNVAIDQLCKSGVVH